MTDRLVGEILLHISSYTFVPARVSFVGHSLGCILIRSGFFTNNLMFLKASQFYQCQSSGNSIKMVFLLELFTQKFLTEIDSRSAISRAEMAHLVPRFYTYLSLSGPHLGTLYNNSGLVNMGE